MLKKVLTIFVLLSIAFIPLASTETLEINYIEKVDSSFLILSDHDSELHGGLNSVFGSAYQLLNQAQHSILIANFIYENPTITEILNRKAAEGVEVTFVYDRERSKEFIKQLHPSITKLTRLKGDGHMHHKFIVVDGEFNWISSANFNRPKDKNLTLVSRDPEMAEVLYEESYSIGSLQARQNEKPFITTIDGQRLELYFLPYNDPKNLNTIEAKMNEMGKRKLLELIEQAKSTIRVSMVVWTFKDSARALVKAKQRGVKVEVVGANVDAEVLSILQQGKVSVHKIANDFHHKWMLIDDQILWNGSANWSMNAFSRTDDSVTILYDLKPEQVVLMEEAWQKLIINL